MEVRNRIRLYFCSWILGAIVCILLNILNVDWENTHPVTGVLVVAVLSLLQGSVLELPLQTIATIVVGGKTRENKRAPCDNLMIALNYNLLATNKADVDECLQTMYTAYVGNLSPKVSAILVSATNDAELKKYELELRDKYRDIIYNDLRNEGLSLAKRQFGDIDDLHYKHIWKEFIDLDSNMFIDMFLDNICEKYAREFMVIHRVSRVLKKCGQYQDLMLLSEGTPDAFSYCDESFYGKQARKKDEKLFHDCRDVDNIFNRKFDYTLVLDGDTGVPRGGVFDLLHIAAAHPDKGIIQPSIKFNCTKDDTIFMHLEQMRQVINSPITNAMTALFGQSGFYGKALIKNKLYVEHVIGNQEHLIERVPVDVLSHDTFEAALLKPLYAGSTYLLEAPCHNYVTWNIRERRWNRGEIILATYFWETLFGNPMNWLQKRFQKSKYNKTKLRTKSDLDFVTSYIAHSALRHMFMKPCLLLYLCISVFAHLKYPEASIIVIMFLILIFPKFAVCSRENYKYVILETVASVWQFTPEAVVGSIRLCRAIHANISLNAKWVPQRAVEEEFKRSNAFVSGFRHLWGYSVFAMIAGISVMLFSPNTVLILPLLITLSVLPLYTGFTSLKPGFCVCWKKKGNTVYTESRSVFTQESSTDSYIPTVSSAKMYQSAGLLWNGYEYMDTTFLLSSRSEQSDMLIDNTYNFGKRKQYYLTDPYLSDRRQNHARKSNKKYKCDKFYNRNDRIGEVDQNNGASHEPFFGKILNWKFRRDLNGKSHIPDYTHYKNNRNGNGNDIGALLRRLKVLETFSDTTYYSKVNLKSQHCSQI